MEFDEPVRCARRSPRAQGLSPVHPELPHFPAKTIKVRENNRFRDAAVPKLTPDAVAGSCVNDYRLDEAVGFHRFVRKPGGVASKHQKPAALRCDA